MGSLEFPEVCVEMEVQRWASSSKVVRQALRQIRLSLGGPATVRVVGKGPGLVLTKGEVPEGATWADRPGSPRPKDEWLHQAWGSGEAPCKRGAWS